MEELIQIHAVLLDKLTKEPLNGSIFKVRFYDQDLLKDDFLGESDLDDFGHAIITVRRSDFQSKDSPFEKYPDIYFEIIKKELVIYKSKTLKNLHLEEARDFPVSEGKHCSLGTFLI